MSRIDDLIADRCPDGVEFKRLGDIARIRNGKDHKKLSDGDVPVYGSGGIMRYADTCLYDKPSVLIPRKGSLGNLFYVDEPFWTVDTIFYTVIDESQVLPKFLYYFLTTVGLGGMNQAGGVPSQTQSVLNELNIPVPPMALQREIAGILERFVLLRAELEAELEAEFGYRSRQYAFCRDQLLTFREAKGTRRVPMGELGSIFGGLTGKSKADFSNGNARFVSYVNVFNNLAVNTERADFVRVGPGERQRSLQRGDILFTGSSESAADVAMSSVVTTAPDGPLYLNSFCIGFRPHESDELDPEFSKHLFRSGPMRAELIRTASGVTRFNVSKARLAKVQVPIPPLTDQRRIASVLNKLDTFVTDLRTGLPAEIAARRQQYEYYRDRLLTFEEAA